MATVRLCLALALALAGCAHVPLPTLEDAGGDPALQARLEEGRRLYVAKCSGCHGLYSVERFSDREWEDQVSEMIRGRKVRLAGEEQRDLIRYLTRLNGDSR